MALQDWTGVHHAWVKNGQIYTGRNCLFEKGNLSTQNG